MKSANVRIGNDAGMWTPIQHHNAIRDEDEQRLISGAEVSLTAFTGPKKKDRVTARLIAQLVNPKPLKNRTKLFDVWRYHAVFTDSPLSMLDAQADHRGTRSSKASMPTCATGRRRIYPRES